MNKFMPAPWRHGSNTHGVTNVFGGPGIRKRIAFVETSDAEGLANLSLIEKAPEMHEVLCQVYKEGKCSVPLLKAIAKILNHIG